jgi:hypothetical protein
MTCVDPLQLGIMERKCVYLSLLIGGSCRNVCSDWLNLVSFLFAAEHSWQGKGGHKRMLNLALL